MGRLWVLGCRSFVLGMWVFGLCRLYLVLSCLVMVIFGAFMGVWDVFVVAGGHSGVVGTSVD